ncbi:MAG: hypothetical protein ABR569_08985 [Gaiellaceae bacterium]
MSFFSRMNPTVRGLGIVALIALVVVVLRLQAGLAVISALISIAFIVAIVFFVYTVWRRNRSDIATWSIRARVTFYGAAALIVGDIGVRWWYGSRGYQLLAFVAVIVICAFAMYRIWRDQHTYGI